VFTFGTAGFFGSDAGKVGTSIVGIAPTPDRAGYRLIGFGEAAYPFGDAVPTAAPTPTPSPVPGKPPAVGSAPVVTTPVPTTLPRPRARHALKVWLSLGWTWDHAVTRLRTVRAGSFPGRTVLTLRCRGRGCPRGTTLRATGRRGLHRLFRRLSGRRYRAGDHLTVTLTAPGYRPERAEVTIRNGRIPEVRLQTR
jgi:hypothetical protein